MSPLAISYCFSFILVNENRILFYISEIDLNGQMVTSHLSRIIVVCLIFSTTVEWSIGYNLKIVAIYSCISMQTHDINCRRDKRERKMVSVASGRRETSLCAWQLYEPTVLWLPHGHDSREAFGSIEYENNDVQTDSDNFKYLLITCDAECKWILRSSFLLGRWFLFITRLMVVRPRNSLLFPGRATQAHSDAKPKWQILMNSFLIASVICSAIVAEKVKYHNVLDTPNDIQLADDWNSIFHQNTPLHSSCGWHRQRTKNGQRICANSFFMSTTATTRDAYVCYGTAVRLQTIEAIKNRQSSSRN